MRTSQVMLILVSTVLVILLLWPLLVPVSPASGLAPPAWGPGPWWPGPWPQREHRLGPGGGIQTGGTVYLPSHPMPWLGPHGGTQTGGNIVSGSNGMDLPAHPVPWLR